MDFTILRSLLLFVLAGIAEIGGGYLVWQWLREGKAIWIGIVGGAVLILYGVISHPANGISLRSRLCCVWRHLCRPLDPVGNGF